MIRQAEKRTRHRRVQLQMVVLLLLFTLLTTLLTGWIIYDRTSDQVIRDTWQQREALLRSACAAVNREIEQIRSFSWQLSNDSGVQRYLHLTEQTPKDILDKRNIIEKLQQMKAFSNTMADIGIYAEGMDIIVTGESSYRAADYYSRVTGVSQQLMTEKRSVAGSVAVGRYAGSGTIRRILSTEPVLAFVSSLPMNAQTGKSYAFFHLNADRLYDCMPESEGGALLLTDGEGIPVMPAEAEEYSGIGRQYMQEKESRIRYDGKEYGVLNAETAAEGLYCMAVIPYSELLKPSLRLRDVVMLVMGSCMVIGLLAAVLASKRLYAPLERLLGNVRQLGHRLPEETRGNEYKMLDEAIHLITAENHELTLSNREVQRILKNRLLNDWMEGRLKVKAEEALAKAGVTLPYDRVRIAVAETAPILILCNLDAQHPDPEAVERYLLECREQVFRDCPCATGIGRVCDKDRAVDSLVDAMVALRSGDEEGPEGKHFTRLTEYIRKEYMNDISLDSASEALGMSPSYIGLVFRKAGGTSFLKYLTDIRMEEAKRLLRTTDLTLREIGIRVGIENQNTLIRTFKKAEGVTPGQYRLSNQTMDSQN